MIRRLLRLAFLGAGGAWILDRALARRAAGTPPPAIRTSVVVRAPAERVWAVLADVEGQPRWMHDLKAVRIEGSGPVGPGTRAVGEVRILGLTVVDPVTITAFEPRRRFAIRHDGVFGGEGDIRLEPGLAEGTTLVSWSEILVPPALPHLVATVLAPVLQQVFQADLDRLRDLVEAGPASS